MTVRSSTGREIAPFWRNVRVLSVLAQLLFTLAVFLLLAYLARNVVTGMERRGLDIGFSFLGNRAGFRISEGIRYTPDDTYGRAFLVGVVNTVRVSVVGILLATLLGIVVGISRLSGNWLVNKLASLYIETIRNTPLLVQLVFWYYAGILQLPRIQQSLQLPGPVYLSNRGLAIPWPRPTPAFRFWLGSLALALLAALAVRAWRARQLARAGRVGFPGLWGLGAFLAVALVGWILAPQSPLALDRPSMTKTAYVGGVGLTPEYTALLVGLVVYTGAFIAEIVRGGILAVPKGQWEAARSLGFSHFQTLYLIVLPQALRIIIPPLGNQYLNLTKNSSLAVAIGFPDMFNVAGTIFNQSGRSLQVVAMVMGGYLSMSLTISGVMNLLNRKLRIKER